MTPEEQAIVKDRLREVAEILYRNTTPEALKIHERAGIAFFQENEALVQWVNKQSLSRTLTCLGDGHDGVWNIIEQIGNSDSRREVLDWYHLMENLHKVGGSNL